MPTEASKAAARDGRCPCNPSRQGCGQTEGCKVSCVEAALKRAEKMTAYDLSCGESAWRNLEVGLEPRTRGGSAR